MRSILLSHLPQSSILLRLFLCVCSHFCLLCLGIDFYFYVAWDLLVFLNLWIIFLLVSSWKILTHDLFSPVPFSLSLLWNSFLNVPECSFNLWSLLTFVFLCLCVSVFYVLVIFSDLSCSSLILSLAKSHLSVFVFWEVLLCFPQICYVLFTVSFSTKDFQICHSSFYKSKHGCFTVSVS